MRPATPPPHGKPPCAEAGKREGRHPERRRTLELLDARARFESLLVDLSATFVSLPADEVDTQIERALQQIVAFLGVDRSSFGEYLEDKRQFLVTHSYVVSGVPPFPRVIVDDELPWYTEKVRQGEVLRFARLPDELPPEAVREREYCTRVGVKSNLTIPLLAGGSMLGAIAFGSFRAYRTWPDDLVQRLRLVGEIFANALARKRAEQALRQGEQRYRDLLETTHGIPWEADAQTLRYRYVGPQVVALLGYPVEQWYQEGFWAAHLHPDDRARMARFPAAVKARGEHQALEYRMIAATGKTVWIHDLITVAYEESVPRAIRGVMIDITARKAAEEEACRLRDQLARVARVTTMGELAAAIAHEVNQPLCAIVTNAQTAQRLLAGGAPEVAEVGETLQDIVSDSRRASEVLARIRTLLQKRQSERLPVDLNDAIREVVALLQYQLTRKGIALSLDLAADLPPVLGDRVQLQQVLLNLILNAVEAMGQVAAGRGRMSIRSARQEGETVVASVLDSGPGLAAEYAEHVFEALFTTKPGGMGIGLAISRSIIEAHGGRIWAEPNAGGGAAFRFAVPAAQETSP